MKKYIFSIITVLMLSLTASAQIMKGTLRIGDKVVTAEFLKLSDNTVAVGNGRNACVSQYESNGLLTIPGEVTIDGITYKVVEVSRLAFRLCNGITGVNIQENTEKIEEYAFIGCSSIQNITLPTSLQTIGAGAFASCYDALKTVTCLADEPAQWEDLDVFRPITGDDLMYSYDKQLFVTNKENYAQADGWKFFPNVKFGQGTYYVYDAADLTLLRDRTDLGNAMAYISDVVLANDIDMTGVTWSHGMGVSEEEPFIAHFDGQGHTITGLTVNSTDCPAFIAHYGGGLIENVSFRNCKSMNPTPTGYSAIVVGESGHFMLSNVWVENCIVAGGQYMGALIGHFITPGTNITDCVVKDIDMKPYPQLGVKAGALVGLAASGNAWHCAVIGNYGVTVNLTEFPDVYSSPIRDFLEVARPFVAQCSDGEQFQMHSSYATKDVFKDYTIPDFMVYDSDVAIAGHKIDIIDTDGSSKQLTLGENDMKTLLMAGILGRQWTYAEGQYPLPDIYGSYFPVEVNKATYCFNATTADDIPVNRLFSRTAQPKDFLNLSANGYKSKEYETSKVWIDDNFATGFGALPIGTATITCNDGVIYDRTLTAPASSIAVEKAQLVDVDKDGEVTITAQGSLDYIGDEIIIDAETAYEPMGYNVCLPYSLQLNGPSHVFYPASIQERDGLQFVTMTESQTIEAWRPCLVTVAQESLPLGTDAQVVFKPKTADSDFKPAGSPYAMIGTKEAQAENGLNYFCLNDDDLWSYTSSSTLLPFRSYFTSTGTDKFVEFTTGMGYRAELVNDTLTFRKGLPLTAEAEGMPWWFVDRAYNNTDDDYFGHLLWSPFAEQVTMVEFDPSFNNARPKIMEGWFYGFHELNTIAGLEYLNTSEVESMFKLFGGCESLTKLDLSHFDTHQVSYMFGMFEGCTSLKKIIIGKDWDTGTPAKPIEMFKGCTSIVGQYGKTYNPDQTSHEYANAGPDGYLWRDYPYYVAVKSGDGTLTFQGSDTAPDGSTVYDATNTGDGQPEWYDYDFKKVVIEPSFLMARPTSCSYWFAQGLRADQGIQTIEGLENLNTSRATSMKGMFTNCQQAVLDVSHFNTHFVTDMSEMFQNCTNLTTLDVSHFNTAVVTTMEEMFAGCEHLTTLDVTGLKTFNVETMQGMFSGCKALTELDLNNFNIDKLTNMTTMFMYCEQLRTLWCDNSWEGVENSVNMFGKCERLEGAVKYKYSETTLDGSMANPETGYFTASPAVTLLDTGDNSEAFAKYDGKIVNLTYDRVLRATDNGDGTYSSRAYTICLPYDLDVIKNWVQGKADVYQLYFIKDNKEFIFSNSMHGGVLKAGHAYLVVVNEGEISLDAHRVTLISQPDEGQAVYDYELDTFAGLWRGTFTKIESADAAAMFAYSLQSDGSFKRIRPDTPWAWWGAFRSMFCAKEFTGNNVYKPAFKVFIAGDEDPIVDLPTDSFEGDTDIPDDETGILHVIDNDGTHRYFDLQGRQLNDKPNRKGIYIDNGKKVIK